MAADQRPAQFNSSSIPQSMAGRNGSQIKGLPGYKPQAAYNDRLKWQPDQMPAQIQTLRVFIVAGRNC